MLNNEYSIEGDAEMLTNEYTIGDEVQFKTSENSYSNGTISGFKKMEVSMSTLEMVEHEECS